MGLSLKPNQVIIGEGNGTPLQYSCLENPRDGGAWRAAVYGVAQSQTRMKQLSSSSKLLFVVKRNPHTELVELSPHAGDVRDVGLNPGSRRSSREENGNPPQGSCLENPMDRGAWWAIVRGVTKSWTRLK